MTEVIQSACLHIKQHQLNLRPESEVAHVAPLQRRWNLRIPLPEPRCMAFRFRKRGFWRGRNAHLVPEEVGRDPVRSNFSRVSVVSRRLKRQDVSTLTAALSTDWESDEGRTTAPFIAKSRQTIFLAGTSPR